MKIINLTINELMILRNAGYMLAWIVTKTPDAGDRGTTRYRAAHSKKINRKSSNKNPTQYYTARDYPNETILALTIHRPNNAFNGANWTQSRRNTPMKFLVDQDWNDILEILVTERMNGL